MILFYHQFFDIIFDQKLETTPEVRLEEVKDTTDNLDTVSEAPSATTTVHTQTTNLSVSLAPNSKISRDSGGDEFINISSSEEEQERPIAPAPVKEKKPSQRQNSQNSQSAKPVVLRPKIINAESNV